ncbi:tRNA 2-selenouridine(34) synthase MnmH [Candidatus Woesearchaeota archaeon CG10_big_fil_rev_8_21_14_0_10_32_24]|nr:MAG: tRNA 2-selenouridine(34) synthase MnmH [Candidatus Woesearchaeota archaeon CG10_big_fil_rev_8_21_14_0_10_32_24]
MIPTISIEEALKTSHIFIDTRTPKEFAEDHLPGAINIPILSNEEREVVGTLYVQVSKQEAIDKGVELFSPKLPSFMKEINQYRNQKLIINCWRGGMRSRAIVALLNSLGYDVMQLEGGYKSFREYVREKLYNYEFKPQLIILWGLTCTGKTKILHYFPHSLNLEGLAQHRSSLFGAIGLIPNSQKRFENLLLRRLDELNQQEVVIVEGEGRRIGDVIIPENIWDKILKGKNIHVVGSLDKRAEIAVAEYMKKEENIHLIKEITQRLWKVISKENQQKVIKFIDQKDYVLAAKILLEFYYDPLYSHTLRQIKFDAEMNTDDIESAVKELTLFSSSLR